MTIRQPARSMSLQVPMRSLALDRKIDSDDDDDDDYPSPLADEGRAPVRRMASLRTLQSPKRSASLRRIHEYKAKKVVEAAAASPTGAGNNLRCVTKASTTREGESSPGGSTTPTGGTNETTGAIDGAIDGSDVAASTASEATRKSDTKSGNESSDTAATEASTSTSVSSTASAVAAAVAAPPLVVPAAASVSRLSGRPQNIKPTTSFNRTLQATSSFNKMSSSAVSEAIAASNKIPLKRNNSNKLTWGRSPARAMQSQETARVLNSHPAYRRSNNNTHHSRNHSGDSFGSFGSGGTGGGGGDSAGQLSRTPSLIGRLWGGGGGH